MPIAPSRQAMTPEMFKLLVDVAPGDCITILLYGPAKSGKTYFMGTAGDRTLFISNGNGHATLLSPLFKEKVGANLMLVEVKDPVDPDTGLPEEAIMLVQIKDAINFALTHFPDKFDTICIDDSTALSKSAFWKGLEINERTGKSKTMKAVEKENVIMSTVQDYALEMSLIMNFVTALIDTCTKYKKHLIIGAHERFTYRKGDQIGDLPTLVKVRPAFTGQTFPDAIASLFDCVFHTEAVGGGSNTAYRVRTAGDEVLLAGNRYGATFSTVEVDLKFTDVIRRIKDGQRAKGK